MKKYVFIHLLFLVLILVSTNVIAQQNLYIDSNAGSDGSGTNNCTNAGLPCLTLTHTFTEANTYPTTTKVIINIAGGSTYLGPITINRSNLTLRGAFANTIPTYGIRDDRSVESIFQFAANSITIADGINDITIEGFEFRTGTASTTVGMVTFTANGNNSNIILRRNSIVGNSGYSGGSSTQVQPFLVKNTGGSLTNIQVIENRFLGYFRTFPARLIIPAISLNSAENGAIRSNIFGSTTQYSSASPTANRVDKAIIMGSVKNFAIAQNQFQGINFSAIELQSTDLVGAAINDAIVRIDSNTFDNVNIANNVTTTVGSENIDAAIKLLANNFQGDSVLIRYNEFINDNKFGIAIPNANNGFTTNSIKIFANKFVNDPGNSQADIYVGSDATLAIPISTQGKIDVNANWWGKTTAPYTPTISTAAGITSDIFGSTTATSFAKPVIWLTSATDANPGLAFIPTNKVVRSNGVDAELFQVFAAVPENWELELADGAYSTIPSVVRSFTLNPLDAAVDGEILPGINLNGSNYDGSSPVVTLKKNIQIANGANVTLTKGKIQLGNYNLQVLGSSGLPEGNEESYIITNSTGKLIQTGIGTTKTGEVIFPIGPDNISYTPARTTNTGASNDFSVIVKPGITTIGNDGNTVTEDAVDLEWDVKNETLVGTPNVTLTLQWNGDPVTGNEQLNFDRSVSYMAHYTGGKWVNLELPPGTAAMAGNIMDSWKKTASGITSFSPFAIGSPGAALPVTLVDFKAALKNNDVELSWITASEKNNAHFSVERSEDGSNFNEIGKINGKGTTNISNAYNFTDIFVTETGRDILYYRLKQVDIDGKFSYSKIQDVVVQTWALRLFPNPANRIVNIALPGNVHLQVISTQGQVVIEKEFESLTQLNVSGLPKGMYIFKFTNSKDILFRKVNIN